MPNRCARALTEASDRFNCIAISKGEPFCTASLRNRSSSSGVHRPQRLLLFISPSEPSLAASRSALRRLWFRSNSGSAWLSDIFCLDASEWSALRSASSAIRCSAVRFGLIIWFLPSGHLFLRICPAQDNFQEVSTPSNRIWCSVHLYSYEPSVHPLQCQ